MSMSKDDSDPDRLEVGQLWMRFGPSLRMTATVLLISFDEFSNSWFVISTRSNGDMRVHIPLFNFVGRWIDKDDDTVNCVRVA